MSSDEETFRRLALESRIMEQNATELQSRINMTNAALAELRVSSMTLRGLQEEKTDAQLFVPIGGASYVKARLESAETIVVGIGADVAIEKSINEAKVELEARIAELEKARDTLGQQFNQLVGRIQENREKLESLSAKLREEGGKASGVRKAKKRS